LLRNWALLAAFFAGTAGVGSLCAQQANGTLTGTVTDGPDSVVPFASVSIIRTGSGDTRVTRTNSAGYFTFAFVPAGDYTLVIDATGFLPWKRSGIVMSPGDKRDAGSIVIIVAVRSESVKVTGEMD